MPEPAHTNAIEHAAPGFRRRGWIGAVVLAPAALATFLLPPVIAAGSWIDVTASALAWPALLAGTGLRFWATLHIGGRKRKQVVREGPYSVCRNPLYLGTVLNALSAALFFKSPYLLAGAGLLGLTYVWLTIPGEERFLTDTLGEAYQEYRRRVPRLLPRPWLFRAATELHVNSPALWRECRRAAWWIWLPVLSYAFERVCP